MIKENLNFNCKIWKESVRHLQKLKLKSMMIKKGKKKKAYLEAAEKEASKLRWLKTQAHLQMRLQNK